MLKLHEIREIIKLIDTSSIEEFELENEGVKLLLRKPKSGSVVVERLVSEVTEPVQTTAVQPVTVAAPVAVPQIQVQETAPVTAAVNDNLHKIVSPMVGTFYKAPSPDAAEYVKVGDKVSEKDVVCIVEAMKLMNEIEAEVRGEIVEVLVENGQLVEYGQPLFLVRPE